MRAVENVSLQLARGETLGLVGESGCGKSTLGKAILGLLAPDAGEIYFNDTKISGLKQKALLPFRKKLQAVFQDPYSSLNPRMNVFEIVAEGLLVHENISGREARKKVSEILNEVNLDDNCLNRYPHEFSGGQRQRIAIARALVLNPEYVICDEAVSALDVSTQAQVVNLFRKFQREKNLGYLFISHDLNVVKYISHRIAVMYLGEIVELAAAADIAEKPLHPYTKSLFSSIYDIESRKKERVILKGEVPGIVNKPSGCYFHTRCTEAVAKCKVSKPELRKISEGHIVACHLSGN